MINELHKFIENKSNIYSKFYSLKKVEVKGVKIGERVFFASNLESPFLLVVGSLQVLQEYKRNFIALGKRVCVLTEVLDSLYEKLSVPYGEKELINSLNAIAKNDVDVVIAYSSVLMQRVPQKSDYLKKVINLSTKDSVNVNNLISSLVEIGYSQVEEVVAEGDFRMRGDTLDLILPNEKAITRIEFFDDEVESIRKVGIEDFKMLEKLDNVSIFPIKLFAENEISSGIRSGKLEQNILSWFSNEAILIDEPSRAWAVLDKAYADLTLDTKRRIEEKILPTEFEKFYLGSDYWKIKQSAKAVSFESFDVGNRFFISQNELFVSAPRNMKYAKDFNQLYLDLEQYNRQNFTIILVAENNEVLTKIEHRLKAMNLAYKNSNKIFENQINILQGELESGFGFLDSKVVVFSLKDYDKEQQRNTTTQEKSRVFYLPKVGDYVVHEKYGIAKCTAISKLNFGINEKDYFVLTYANNGVLYVPTEKINELSSYVGENEPKLDTLGSDTFKKAKAKAKESVKKLAYDLKKLYAIREKQIGQKYYVNEELLQEFSESFGFELTDDQKSAIQEIKDDLANGKIMERLVCGDVGFGKTEVAMHASFITILNHKQVALLCPTTVLCQQHFMSFSKRMESFGIKVAQLSRFQTTAKNKEVLQKLKSGEVNIVCGTKRMLSADVEFNDLGLLILDEEQRFGVNDKEKIKTLKKDVNVLSLSATPIPRTLNMSLMGVRDISLITTPPKNRQSVQTIVCEENSALIKEACERELERCGQVLIINNRVENIFEVANKIKKLIPNAEIGVAHGQMSRAELEAQILDLYSQKIQIMVATSLIENGIDLPMANTLIVLNSNYFGLSQLYQLKGRVGRSSRSAYAYFMYKKENVLTQSAFERLKAIKDFSSLGSGFKLAMRDLELRGAGEILGATQHGHIVKIGYDMYCKLMEEALNELNGENEDFTIKKDINLDIVVPAFIPHSFIPSENERIVIYNKMSALSSREKVEALKKSLAETYGNLPSQVDELCEVAYLKNIGQELNIKKIEIKSNSCFVEFYELKDCELLEILKKAEFKQSLLNVNKFELKANIGALELQKALIKTLIQLKNNEKKDRD